MNLNSNFNTRQEQQNNAELKLLFNTKLEIEIDS